MRHFEELIREKKKKRALVDEQLLEDIGLDRRSPMQGLEPDSSPEE